MAAIPWWLKIIIDLAIKVGSPLLLGWIKDKIKSLPDEIRKIIEELINGINDPDVDTKEAKKEARNAFKRECSGVACPPDLK